MSEPRVETCMRCEQWIPAAMGREVVLREPLLLRHSTEADCIEALKECVHRWEQRQRIRELAREQNLRRGPS